MFKIGLVGTGIIADFHKKAIDKNSEVIITAVCDIDIRKAENAAERTNASVYTDYKEMAEKESLSQQEEEKIAALLSNYSKNMKTQSDTESLITAKTGSDCIVVINGEACQVIMEKNTLNDTVILQITEIITKNTNISAKNLTIIEAK